MKSKVVKMMVYFVYLVAIILVGLEISFRWYVYDFYRPELNGLNREILDLENDEETILVIGDSFTANLKSYVSVLRDSLPKIRIINSAVPGTTVKQNLLSLKDRIEEFSPDRVIYQIYVGNDILEFRHPSNIGSLGLIRSTYWWIIDRIYVVGFANYRFGKLRKFLYADLESRLEYSREELFSSRQYAPRSKMYFAAEPSMIEDVVMMKNDRESDVIEYASYLGRSIRKVPDSIPIDIVVVPHCSQVSIKHLENMKTVGMKVCDSIGLLQSDYPFFRYLQRELSDKQISVLNPLKVMQALHDPEKLYYENDPHFNDYGHQILGQYLLSSLEMAAHSN